MLGCCLGRVHTYRSYPVETMIYKTYRSLPRFQELHRQHVIQFPRVKGRDHQYHMAFLKYFLTMDNAPAKILVEI